MASVSVPFGGVPAESRRRRQIDSGPVIGIPERRRFVDQSR